MNKLVHETGVENARGGDEPEDGWVGVFGEALAEFGGSGGHPEVSDIPVEQ